MSRPSRVARSRSRANGSLTTSSARSSMVRSYLIPMGLGSPIPMSPPRHPAPSASARCAQVVETVSFSGPEGAAAAVFQRSFELAFQLLPLVVAPEPQSSGRWSAKGEQMLPMLRDREGGAPRLSRLDQLFNETLSDWFGGRMTEALERGGWFLGGRHPRGGGSADPGCRSPGARARRRRGDPREQRPDDQGRAALRGRGQARHLPSCGAVLRVLHAVVHAAAAGSTPPRSTRSSPTACWDPRRSRRPRSPSLTRSRFADPSRRLANEAGRPPRAGSPALHQAPGRTRRSIREIAMEGNA